MNGDETYTVELSSQDAAFINGGLNRLMTYMGEVLAEVIMDKNADREAYVRRNLEYIEALRRRILDATHTQVLIFEPGDKPKRSNN
jgi:hypothetical protein